MNWYTPKRPFKNRPKQKFSLVGAGAHIPAPLYQRWFKELNNTDPNLQVDYQKVDYQTVGSGAGIQRFTQELVHFSASDVAMKDEEIAKVSRGVIMLPMTAVSIVLIYNVPGVSELKLSREAYVDIFLGKITNWNDPKITKINPGVNLPDLPITVAHRLDSHLTTKFFTNHLSDISSE